MDMVKMAGDTPEHRADRKPAGRELEMEEPGHVIQNPHPMSPTERDRDRNILSISPRMLGPNLGSGDITPVVDAPGYEPFAGEP